MTDTTDMTELAELAELPGVVPCSLRDVMRQFATGITVLTTAGDHCHGMTANAFSSVSLDPPLVLCCVAGTATMHGAISRSGGFAVSILDASQEHLARYFTDKRRPRGAAQFDTVDCRPGPHTGAPLMSGALAWLECTLTASYEGGDHSIFVGRVLGSSRGTGSEALLHFGGAFERVAPGVR
jgi:flavin reductase